MANPTGLVECAYCGARYPEGEPFACCGEQHFFAVTQETLDAEARDLNDGLRDEATDMRIDAERDDGIRRSVA